MKPEQRERPAHESSRDGCEQVRDAYLCDRHALAGVAMTLTVAPNRTQEASLAVVCGRSISDMHSTAIRQPLEQAA